MTNTGITTSSARADYTAMIQAIGPGFHPDTRGQDYTSLPAGYTAERVEAIVLAAHREGNLDIYVWALAVLEGEVCWMCDQPTYAGDEPGEGYLDRGAAVPLCSVACTEAFYTADDA